MTITTEKQHPDAQKRIEEITSGDFVDAENANEPRELHLAVAALVTSTNPVAPANASQLTSNANASSWLATTIASIEEYEAATARAQALLGCNEGSPEEAELDAISDAITAWDQRHDAATLSQMKLTAKQIDFLRHLQEGSIQSEPTEELMALVMLRLVVRGGSTWIITEMGEDALIDAGQ